MPKEGTRFRILVYPSRTNLHFKSLFGKADKEEFQYKYYITYKLEKFIFRQFALDWSWLAVPLFPYNAFWTASGLGSEI